MSLHCVTQCHKVVTRLIHMPFPLTASQISAALETPLLSTTDNWPLLESALNQQGIGSNAVCIATLATVKVECPPFHPIHEYGSPGYFQAHYQGRIDLGNTHQGDGILYAGRGFIQITGRNNYRAYGQRLGVDLETYPDKALEPKIAASILALFFKDRGVDAAAELGNWVRVRQLVNGSKNGLAPFLAAEEALAMGAAYWAAEPAPSLPPLPALEAKTHLGIVQTLRDMLHSRFANSEREQTS